MGKWSCNTVIQGNSALPGIHRCATDHLGICQLKTGHMHFSPKSVILEGLGGDSHFCSFWPPLLRCGCWSHLKTHLQRGWQLMLAVAWDLSGACWLEFLHATSPMWDGLPQNAVAGFRGWVSQERARQKLWHLSWSLLEVLWPHFCWTEAVIELHPGSG